MTMADCAIPMNLLDGATWERYGELMARLSPLVRDMETFKLIVLVMLHDCDDADPAMTCLEKATAATLPSAAEIAFDDALGPSW